MFGQMANPGEGNGKGIPTSVFASKWFLYESKFFKNLENTRINMKGFQKWYHPNWFVN